MIGSKRFFENKLKIIHKKFGSKNNGSIFAAASEGKSKNLKKLTIFMSTIRRE